MKVLIADDNEFMRTILKDILAKTAWSDAEILEATSGEEAIAMSHEQQPDLILLDMVMPGKGGIEVLKAIGPSDTMRVVVVSSIEQDYIIEHAMSLGAKGYVMKPVDPMVVTETVNGLFPKPLAVSSQGPEGPVSAERVENGQL